MRPNSSNPTLASKLRAIRSGGASEFRATYHPTKGGWTPPDLRADAASRMINFVIRRIEFPKYGEPYPFSATSRADAQAAGMTACVQAGFFEHGHGGPKVLKAIRSAIQGKTCLRLRCKWEYATDDAAGVAAQVGFTTEAETVEKRLSKSQRDMAREIMRTLRASQAADAGRKALASFRSQRDFFLIVLGHLTETKGRAMSPGTFDTRKSRFVDYLAQGACHLRANRLPPPCLASEIMQALASRALT